MAGPTEYSAATSENIAAKTASSAARSLTDDKTLSNGKLVVTVQEIMQALDMLGYGASSPNSHDGPGEESPYACLDPSSLLALEYETAAAEALYTYRVGNLNPNLEDPERKRLIHSTQNALRVKTHSVRKHYGIAIKPRKTKRAPKQKATETDIDDNSRLPGEGEEQFTSYVTALSKDTSSAEESDEIKDIVSPPYRVSLVTQHHRHTAGCQSSLPLSALSKEELPITRDRNEQRRSSSRASYIPVRRPGTVFLYRMG